MRQNNSSLQEGGTYFPPQHAPSSSTENFNSTITSGTPVTELPSHSTPSNPVPANATSATNSTPRSGPAQRVPFIPINRNESAIRLRRLRQPAQSSNPLVPIRSHQPQTQAQDWENVATGGGGRRRSSSEPQRPSMLDVGTGNIPRVTTLPPVQEGTEVVPVLAEDPAQPRRFHRLLARRRRGNTMANGQPSNANGQQQGDDDVYDSRIVDFLDVVDPEVATLSSITNIQNSLFLPSLGKWVNRRPTYDLSHLPPISGAFAPSKEDIAAAEQGLAHEKEHRQQKSPPAESPPARSPSLSSLLSSEPQYAILPNNASLEGWKEEDVKLLNDYVRHMLHSRRSKIKQRFKAFGQYCRRPLGFLITLYATLITLFGLAWVLFLIGWIYVGEKQLYVINVIDYVLVALFAIVGDGMAPFRAVDTYHMYFVAKYHRKTWKMRKKLLLPALKDHNDLPTEKDRHKPAPSTSRNNSQEDLEAQRVTSKDTFYPVLSDKEQELLTHHQMKLAKSHTFYKPHETETHHAFPLRLLIAVVLLLDLHSCLQISLGAVTFGIPYETRPAAATTTILCCSITANIMAGVLISIGDRRTRKKEVLDRLMRQEMTEEMMKKIKKDKRKEVEEKEKREKEERELTEGTRIGISLPLGDRDVGVTVPIPWRDSEDRTGSRKSVDGKSGGRKSEDSKRRTRSLSVGRSRDKKVDEVGRFNSDIGVVEGTQGKDKGKQRVPGTFNKEDEDEEHRL
ncbi:hypothetical protein QBC38DRAFT_488303 [Podospora fimiseda]|uniref:Integral membrane protein n=1 Tax=Podospora fimiseda TaxID=252190 RepID=A0AAN7BGZ0_9PEZI|nr:hypothetical protein QBC38DRAFT_488303 [Podospora fimiseda]